MVGATAAIKRRLQEDSVPCGVRSTGERSYTNAQVQRVRQLPSRATPHLLQLARRWRTIRQSDCRYTWPVSSSRSNLPGASSLEHAGLPSLSPASLISLPSAGLPLGLPAGSPEETPKFLRAVHPSDRPSCLAPA